MTPGGRPPADDEGTIISGGVSSDIRLVRSAQGSQVVKRALEKLNVDADWHADPARSAIEVRGLCVMARLLGQQHVPRVLWADADTNQFAMALVADRFRNWKQTLLGGEVDLATAAAAGSLLGHLHTRSSREPGLAMEFSNTNPFDQLRIVPFFERVARKNPAVSPAIFNAIENIRTQRVALVHGDYSPKNLLADGGELVILDCEVAHWGDPRFDVAFCVAHLLLKSFRREAPHALLLCAVHVFLHEYGRSGLAVIDDQFARQVGCLVLARLEGDSPVDYLDDLHVADVKQFACELIAHPSVGFGPGAGLTARLPDEH